MEYKDFTGYMAAFQKKRELEEVLNKQIALNKKMESGLGEIINGEELKYYFNEIQKAEGLKKQIEDQETEMKLCKEQIILFFKEHPNTKEIHIATTWFKQQTTQGMRLSKSGDEIELFGAQ